jgi:glucose/arabinose dehydrogenase
MLEKEYRWELVNYQLYIQLKRLNTYSNLTEILSELVRVQGLQLSILQNMMRVYSIQVEQVPTTIQSHNKLDDLIDELHNREYQMLQEYLSYSNYFIPHKSAHQYNLQELINSQTSQVNILIQLKDSIGGRKINPNHGHDDNHKHKQEQHVNQPDYILESGYKLEKVVSNLTFPTDLTFDDQGHIYICEAGFAYGTKPGEGRILRWEKDDSLTPIADGFKGPVTSILWHQGYFIVAEGARGGNDGPGCGQITRVEMDGTKKVIVSNLMSCGDHFTGGMTIGPDGQLYFSVGTATNSAVVGKDNIPWLKRHPRFHDTPARDIVLNGTNFISPNPLTEDTDVAVTGPYKPFGLPSGQGEVIKGNLYSNGVIYSCQLDGSGLRIVADGFRNPFGLRFSPFTGRLYATDNGADPRGSRPVQHDWDNFWEITFNGWHGHPEFFSGLPVTLPHFHVEGQPKPSFVYREHPYLASQPLLRFKNHSSSNKFDFSISKKFGHVGEVFVAQTGDMDWGHHEVNFGFKVVRVDTVTGQIRDFLVNPHGEANKKGPIRPVAAVFNPNGDSLYVIDFGILGSVTGGKPQRNTGAIWRIVKE